MIIHCTQKLTSKVPQVSTTPLAESSPLGSWHANLYTIDRRQCVLFCHDKSRYALFQAGLRKENFKDLGGLHRKLFLDTLAVQGIMSRRLKMVELALGPPLFDRATNRSVLGSMNVVRSDLEGWLVRVRSVMDLPFAEISAKLSKRPCMVEGRDLWPDLVMQQLVESL